MTNPTKLFIDRNGAGMRASSSCRSAPSWRRVSSISFTLRSAAWPTAHPPSGSSGFAAPAAAQCARRDGPSGPTLRRSCRGERRRSGWPPTSASPRRERPRPRPLSKPTAYITTTTAAPIIPTPHARTDAASLTSSLSSSTGSCARARNPSTAEAATVPNGRFSPPAPPPRLERSHHLILPSSSPTPLADAPAILLLRRSTPIGVLSATGDFR